jgi:predicted nucleotidyltransferase
MPTSNRGEDATVDLDRLREALGQHPVRLAVLFGSAASGRTHAASDVDIAIEFEDAVEDEKGELLALLTDLSIVLDRNDVDVALVSDLKPAVGLAAFSDGILVVGSRERMEIHRERFERETERIEADRPSLRERFDTAIEGVDRALRKSS